ncbi:hypothetical protein Tco_1265211 [Tanacetum coccineum]
MDLLAALPSPPLPPPLYIPPPVDRRDDIPESEDTWIDPAEDLYALLEDAQDSRSRISQRMVKEEAYASREAWAHSIGLSQTTHQELQTHRDHVYAHETHIKAHQAQLQLQSTLIQTHHQEDSPSDESMSGESTCRLSCWHTKSSRGELDGTRPDARIPDHQDAWGMLTITRTLTPNGDASHSSHRDDRRNVQTVRPCYYADFMKCQPLNFKGTEGVVGLNYGGNVNRWQYLIRSLGSDAYTMTWVVLKKKMTDKYCPLGEVQKLEIELWNLKVKGNDVRAYMTQTASKN